MSDLDEQAERTLGVILQWARARRDIRGVALVGSRARGTPRPNSDIDLVLLASAPEAIRTEASWVESIDWSAIGAHVVSWRDEDYGILWSRRIWLAAGLEVEFGFAPLCWACPAPPDAGTQRVIWDGCRILHDPDGFFERLVMAVTALRPVTIGDGLGTSLHQRTSVLAIRPATPEDIGAVARLHRAVRRACLPYLPELHTPEQDLGFFRERVFPTCTVWVGGCGARLAGYCAFRDGWVDHLYVEPAAQGKGLGSALLHQAMAGQSHLKLWVFQKNTPAIRFYSRRGFRLVELGDGSGNEEGEPDALYEWRR
jgi:putative acetyltransferase